MGYVFLAGSKMDANANVILGNSTILPNLDAGAAHYINACRFQATESAGVVLLSMYLSGSAAGNMRMAIYTDNAGAPDALLAETSVTPCASGWNNLALPSAVNLTAGAYYWIAWQYDTASNNLCYASGSANQTFYMGYIFGAFPATMPGGGYTAVQWSINGQSTPPASGGRRVRIEGELLFLD